MSETVVTEKMAVEQVQVEPQPLRFREHHDRLDDYVQDCNEELRRRGFHTCEAHVTADWRGNPTLVCNAMTNGQATDGSRIVMTVNCLLPMPWVNRDMPDLPTTLNQALASVEKGMIDLCAKAKVLRIAFNEFGRQVSRTIATLQGQEKPNGRPSIVTP